MSVSEHKTLTLHIAVHVFTFFGYWGWSGGAKVRGKLSVPGRPTNLYNLIGRRRCSAVNRMCNCFNFSAHIRF